MDRIDAERIIKALKSQELDIIALGRLLEYIVQSLPAEDRK